jgi:hypothetical protein
MWRGDRDASRTPSGKGQRGLVAVYLTKGQAGLLQGDWRCIVFSFGASGTGVWLNTRTTPWAAAALKAEDDAG